MPGLGTCHNLELSHGNRERQRVSHRRRPVWLISVFQEPVATDFASRAADISTSHTASDNQKIQLWFLQCYRAHNAARKISGDPSLVSCRKASTEIERRSFPAAVSGGASLADSSAVTETT